MALGIFDIDGDGDTHLDGVQRELCEARIALIDARERHRDLQAALSHIRRELDDLYGRLRDTYMGGYVNERDLEIFRHGMETVSNVVRAVLEGRPNQAPRRAG